jgi:hypothetical protein
MLTVNSVLAPALASYYFVQRDGGLLTYSGWVVLLFAVNGGTVSLIPSAVFTAFGPKWSGSIYGLIQTGSVSDF